MLRGVLVLVVSALSTLGVMIGGPPAPQSAPNVRVGTYDSRAVAVAYYRSATFGKQLKEMRAQRDRAQAAGDTRAVEQWEAKGRALQEQVHRQGFGTAPIDNILPEIKAELAALAKAHNLDAIVSQWSLAYERPGAPWVDVTDELVKCFKPDEATLEVVRKLRQQPPALPAP